MNAADNYYVSGSGILYHRLLSPCTLGTVVSYRYQD